MKKIKKRDGEIFQCVQIFFSPDLEVALPQGIV